MLHMSAEWLQPLIILSLMVAAVVVFTRRNLGSVNTYAGETGRNLILTALLPAPSVLRRLAGPGTDLSSSPLQPWALICHRRRERQDAQSHEQYNGLRHPGLVRDDSHVYGVVMALCIFTGAFWLSPGHSPGTGLFESSCSS